MAYTTTRIPPRNDDELKPLPRIITGNGLQRCDQCRSQVEHVRDIGGRSLCDDCFLAQFPPDNAPQTLHCDLCQAQITHAHETDDGLLLCEECAASYRPDDADTAIITREASLPDRLNDHKQAILHLEGQQKRLEGLLREHVLEIGKHLAEVRDELTHNKAGGFEAWIETELGWSKQTAYNYLNVHERFGNRVNFTRVELPKSTMYMLAAKSTPDDVCEQVIQRAEQGEQLTIKEVERMIKEALRQQQTARQPMETARLGEAPSTATAPKTSCLFCKRRDLPVHVPEPGSRVGICRPCAQKALAQLSED